MAKHKDQRQQTVDTGPTQAIFFIAVLGHLLLALAAQQWVFSPGDIQPFWPAAGVSVGIALSSDRWPTRIAAVLGGVSAQAIYTVLAMDSLTSTLAYTVGVAVEIVLATAAVLTLYTVQSMQRSPGPLKSVFALLLCIGAAAIGSVIALIGHPAPPDQAEWILAHGIGIFACASAVLIGRTGWLSTANPANHARELVFSLAAVAGLTAIAFSTQGALHYVVLGSVLLVTTRFGVRIGQPLALILIGAAALQISTGTGAFVTGEVFDTRSFQTFAAITVVSAAMVGRLTMRLDQQLRERTRSARRWQKLAASGSDGYVEVDADRQIIDISEGLAHSLGLRADQTVGMQLRDLFDKDGWNKIEHFAKLVLNGRSVRFDRSFQTADGDTRWAMASIDPRLDSNGTFAGCTIYIVDTTDAHQINAERVETQVAIAKAQEAERRKLAQRVHDGALQDFAAANLLVGAAGLHNPPELNDSYLARIEELLCGGMRKLRTDAIGSDDIDLREVIVIEALEEVVEKFSVVNSATVTITERRLSEATPERARVIFQIAQEALVNALVHSQAGNISVSIIGDHLGFIIRVVDDGIGFDQRRVTEVGHLGINNMNALAYSVEGWCSVSTQNCDGTRVEAWVPRQASGEDVVALGARLSSLRDPL